MNYYEILGVRPDATPEELRTAYREQSKRCHPDVGGSEAAMKALNAAWACLRDPVSRARYDRSRQGDGRQSPDNDHLTLDDIDRMSPTQVLSVFVSFFHATGSLVTADPDHPNGYDLTVQRPSGETFVVRLCIWQGKRPVQVMEVTHCAAGALACGASSAWVISNQAFSAEAARAAERLGVTWFNRERLAALLEGGPEPRPSQTGPNQGGNDDAGPTEGPGQTDTARPWWSYVEPSWIATVAAVAFLLFSVSFGPRSHGVSQPVRPRNSATGSTPVYTPPSASTPQRSNPFMATTPAPVAAGQQPANSVPPSTAPAPGGATSTPNPTTATTNSPTPAVGRTPASSPTTLSALPDESTYFTLGSTKDEVRAVMGVPDRTQVYQALDKEDWSYGYSQITFDNSGKVKEWRNGGNLKVTLRTTEKADTFTMGSSKDVVAAAMGTPSAIAKYPALDKEDWSYGYSTVTFSSTGVVKEWSNQGNLKVVLLPSSPVVSAGFFTAGSTKDEVVAVMGTPTSVHKYPALDTEEWRYGYSQVTFSNAGAVKSWSNQGNLKVR